MIGSNVVVPGIRMNVFLDLLSNGIKSSRDAHCKPNDLSNVWFAAAALPLRFNPIDQYRRRFRRPDEFACYKFPCDDMGIFQQLAN